MTRFFLQQGAHATGEAGYCAMELSAYLAGEKHSDSPKCVSPVIAAFMRRLNDRLGDEERQDLLPYCIQVLGTNTGVEDDRRRGFVMADFAIRVAAPYWLDRAGLKNYAARLRACDEVVNKETAREARKVSLAAKGAAYAYAYDAAYAAYAAADAADADAAYAAAAYAAYAAADAAAADAAAADAAADAAGRKLAWRSLRADTFKLLDRLIAVGDRTATELVPERVACYREICGV